MIKKIKLYTKRKREKASLPLFSLPLIGDNLLSLTSEKFSMHVHTYTQETSVVPKWDHIVIQLPPT